MSDNVRQPDSPSHLVLPEKTGGQLTAHLRLPALDAREVVGRAIGKAVAMVGWSHKEAADRVGVNDSQFGKWVSGNEPPQVHRVFAVPELRQPLVVALAEEAACEIETTVRIRRQA